MLNDRHQGANERGERRTAAQWCNLPSSAVRDMMLDALADEDLERVRVVAEFEHVPQLTVDEAAVCIVAVLDHELAALARAASVGEARTLDARSSLARSIERAKAVAGGLVSATRPRAGDAAFGREGRR